MSAASGCGTAWWASEMLKWLLNFAVPSWLVYGLAALAIAGALYAKGRIDQALVAEITALKIEIEQERENNRKLAEWIARLKKAAQDDAAEKAKDDAELTDLKTKYTDLVETLSDPDRECLGADDVDRLLGLWGQAKDRAGDAHRR